jgi:hypothetical protein
MGSESTFMYNVLIQDLHPRVAQASRPDFETGNFREAVNNAFGAVELMIKEATAGLASPPDWTEDFSRHVNVLMAQTDSWGAGIKGRKGGVETFRNLVTGGKEFFYNTSKHGKVTFSAASAFAAIATAHIIAETVEHRELPWLIDSSD